MRDNIIMFCLTCTTLWANSTDDWWYFSLFFPENRIWHFMHFFLFSFFPENRIWHFMQNVFLFFPESRIWYYRQIVQWRQFVCNVISCFLEKIWKKIEMLSAENFTRSAKRWKNSSASDLHGASEELHVSCYRPNKTQLNISFQGELHVRKVQQNLSITLHSRSLLWPKAKNVLYPNKNI